MVHKCITHIKTLLLPVVEGEPVEQFPRLFTHLVILYAFRPSHLLLPPHLFELLPKLLEPLLGILALRLVRPMTYRTDEQLPAPHVATLRGLRVPTAFAVPTSSPKFPFGHLTYERMHSLFKHTTLDIEAYIRTWPFRGRTPGIWRP